MATSAARKARRAHLQPGAAAGAAAAAPLRRSSRIAARLAAPRMRSNTTTAGRSRLRHIGGEPIKKRRNRSKVPIKALQRKRHRALYEKFKTELGWSNRKVMKHVGKSVLRRMVADVNDLSKKRLALPTLRKVYKEKLKKAHVYVTEKKGHGKKW